MGSEATLRRHPELRPPLPSVQIRFSASTSHPERSSFVCRAETASTRIRDKRQRFPSCSCIVGKTRWRPVWKKFCPYGGHEISASLVWTYSISFAQKNYVSHFSQRISKGDQK
jgi:hypothetical protein